MAIGYCMAPAIVCNWYVCVSGALYVSVWAPTSLAASCELSGYRSIEPTSKCRVPVYHH